MRLPVRWRLGGLVAACGAGLGLLGLVLGIPRLLPALLQVGHANRLLPELDEADAAALGLEKAARCEHLARLGHASDGGWVVCMDGITPLEGKGRVVYSFGVRDDWSFDVTAAALGFNVVSFDPTVELGAKPDEPRLEFRKWALAANDYDPPADEAHQRRSSGGGADGPERWTRRSLATIMATLGHSHIDVLKADIEWSEWEVLPAILPTLLSEGRVGQLLLEVHLREDFAENVRLAEILRQIRAAGFDVFHREDNVMWGNLVRVGWYGPIVRCCFNVSWRWRGGGGGPRRA